MNDSQYVVIYLGKKNGKKIQKYEHRIVAEKMLGRPLKKNEIVHHKDENKRNNSPDNIVVMTRRDHMKEHHTGCLGSAYRHDVDTKDLIKEYLCGTPLRQISRMFNIARTSIKTRLKRAGVWRM